MSRYMQNLALEVRKIHYKIQISITVNHKLGKTTALDF